MSDSSFIDVRKYACPMSSVQARVQLDQKKPGDKISVSMKGNVAKDNITTLLRMLNYQIISINGPSETDEWSISVIKP